MQDADDNGDAEVGLQRQSELLMRDTLVALLHTSNHGSPYLELFPVLRRPWRVHQEGEP